MCYAHNQWYDISCATLYLLILCDISFRIFSKFFNAVIRRYRRTDLKKTSFSSHPPPKKKTKKRSVIKNDVLIDEDQMSVYL